MDDSHVVELPADDKPLPDEAERDRRRLARIEAKIDRIHGRLDEAEPLLRLAQTWAKWWGQRRNIGNRS